MNKMKSFALPLMFLVLCSGCALIQKPAPIASAKLCKDWRHMTITPDDQLTEKTASEVEVSNKSRPAWGCKYGENKAK